MYQFNRLIDDAKIIVGASNGILTTTVGDTDYVSMKGYERLTILVAILNATTVTGTTITLKQATAVAGTGEKALAFSTVYSNVDVAAGEALTATAVTSNTFTTDTTNSKSLLYVIEVSASDLDVTNGFDCVRLDGTGAVASLGTVIYLMRGQRYSTNVTATGN
jgi:hypothetical protein